jgi:predicted MFS family arabinose efflux permease
MIKTLQKNFNNFPREIWIIALVTFVNRAGAMVIPFLSKYMNDDLKFTYSQIGWIMVCFGLGSIFGTWLSGILSDSIGFHKVILISVFSTGSLFFVLQFITSFVLMCFGIFLLTTFADLYRPAMIISLNSYTKKSNRTRALTLIRSAVNLGFLVGSLIGGFLILNLGFDYLFYIDSVTCFVSVFIFYLFVKEKKLLFESKKEKVQRKSNIILNDKPFLIHLIVTTISGILFFQIFTVLPLYQAKQFSITQYSFAIVLFVNAAILLLFELPIVNFIEKKRYNKTKIISLGLTFMILSYMLLIFFKSNGIVLIFMSIILSIGVMLTFPFSSNFTMIRSKSNQEGKYMSVFTMSYSFAHILGAKSSLFIIGLISFNANWIFMILLGLIGIYLNFLLNRFIERENKIDDNKLINSLFKR